MEKAKNSSIWTEAGYNLFAEEGMEGIQVERLARILKLNKSDFYHYFGDLEVYTEALMKLHHHKADLYLNELRHIEDIDPGYFNLVVRHRTPIMFQVHLVRNNSVPLFQQVAEHIDQREDALLSELWSDYLGLRENPHLAIRYFNIVRDMFYARLSFPNLNYSFLHNLMTEARIVMRQISESRQESDPVKSVS